ncbi:MAG: hypothetical protein Kow00121_17220 [Elainellaceae cyanobacterium]
MPATVEIAATDNTIAIILSFMITIRAGAARESDIDNYTSIQAFFGQIVI